MKTTTFAGLTGPQLAEYFTKGYFTIDGVKWFPVEYNY
jgi:hypothetical protein